MNCNEVKNLLFEASNFNEIMADKQLQAHVSECSKCRAALKLEQKLREGFGSITKQGPPADIAAKILALSESEQSPSKVGTWWQAILESLTHISLRTVAVSCLAGFMIAMFVFRQSEPIVYQQDFAQETDKAIRAPVTEVETPPVTETRISKTATKAEAEMVVALNEDADVIPGAETSFSIHDETQSLVSNRLNEQKAFFMTQGKAAAPSMRAAETFDSQSSPQILFNKIADASADTTVKKSTDPQALELEKLLKEAGIPLKPGRLDLSQLAMQGLISSEKLILFRPAPGSHWFIENHEGITRIILKNNK